MYKPDQEDIFRSFWREIICDNCQRMVSTDIDFYALKKELYDYYITLQEVPKVYDYITGGRFSKPNTDAQHVIDAAEDYFERRNIKDEDTFWYVFNPFGKTPSVRHDTEQSARMEAERLSAKHPSQEFQVLKYVASCRTNIPNPEWTDGYLYCPF